MPPLLKDIRDFFFPAQKDSQGKVIGYRWDSWQTMFWLSIFSVAMSALTTPSIIQVFISSCGWIFLILGVWWFVYLDPVKKTLVIPGTKFFIGPWIVGALTCVFIFGTLYGKPVPASFISWPIISSIYAAIPRFIKSDPDTKEPKFTVPKDAGVRQELVLIILSNLMLSCWVQLYFSIQDWLQAYPSLASDNFQRSAFVVRLQPSEERSNPQGNQVLELAENNLKARLRGRPWSEVERWLLPTNLNQEMAQLEADVRNQLPTTGENGLWRLTGRVVSGVYDLEMQAIWQGPSANPNGYYYTKSCQITQVRQPAPGTIGRSTPVAAIRCSPTNGPNRPNPGRVTWRLPGKQAPVIG